MARGSDELLEAAGRFARAISKAAAKEGPAVRRATGRIMKEDLPALQKAAERTARQAVDQIRRRVG